MLDRLEQLQPRFSRLHQERGLCYVALKDAPRAIEALLRAVNINPALPMSWRMLEGVYRLSGDAGNAATAAAHVATLKGLPPEVVTATSLFSDGDLAPAEQIIRAYLLRHGDQPEAMRLLAKIGMAHDVLDDAEQLLAAVLQLAPDYRAARLDYAQTLSQRHKYVQARDQARLLIELEPGNLDYRSLAATAAVGLGEHDQAIALYRQMLADAPGSPDLNLWLGHALKTVGRVPEAIEAYRAAAATRPDFGDAYWSLANLKLYRFSDAEMARMRARGGGARHRAGRSLSPVLRAGQGAGGPRRDRRVLALLRTRQRPEARGKPLSPGDHRDQHRQADRGLHAETSSRAATGWGDAAPDPIFILGLPRSGSTLLEQILASHSQVEGTQELADIQRIVLEMQGREPDLDNPRYPAALADMTGEDFAPAGRALPGGHAGLPHATSRSSSTRCRTTSGISA